MGNVRNLRDSAEPIIIILGCRHFFVVPTCGNIYFNFCCCSKVVFAAIHPSNSDEPPVSPHRCWWWTTGRGAT
ncbi:hypothetical protein L596_003478 [Steinernema carpocapsae]|uniref:Uncharacterized protein n=1 Tax=Steinernema carpocapsae TaxID=34508 RepID=A0A4U8UVU5_STECR|nr:hypothetical protein L596_003478 [Steinernema carpocapsae]